MKPMKLCVGNLIILGLTQAPFAQAPPLSPSLTAMTGEPVIVDIGDGVVMPGFTDAEYAKATAPLAKSPNFVPIRQKPGSLTSQARFGYNFRLADPRVLSWIIDGNDKDGYVLIADVNGNGDLSDDARLPFERVAGKPTVVFRTTGRDPATQDPFPVVYTIHVERTTLPGDTEPRLALRRFNTTFQRGVIGVGNQRIAFGIVANAGSPMRLILDFNGDGELDQRENSPEAYDVSENIVRIAGHDYEFRLGAHGQRLTLLPLAKDRPATAVLRPGYPAPNFSFTDLDGRQHQLSEYRGKVVLVDFWTTHCGPCLESMPRLLSAYAKHHASGFEILGIDGDDTPEELRTFIAQKAMPWPQTIAEKTDGPLHKQFRFAAWPTYYLVGRDGVILARSMGSDEFLADLPALLRAPASRLR